MIYVPQPQQRLISAHQLEHEENVTIAGMGLGKTVATLSSLDELMLCGASSGALIVAPLRVANLTWPNERDAWDQFRWLPMHSLRTEEGRERWRAGERAVYTINYDQIKHLVALLKECCPVDTIIWDELSKAKDPSSKRVRAMIKERHRFRRHWGLTGTPAPNSYLDLWNQYRLIDGGKTLGPSYDGYRVTYFEPDYSAGRGFGGAAYKWRIRDGAAAQIEKRIAPRTITLRSEDYLDIPPTEVIDVDVPLTGDALKAYRTLERDLLLQIKNKEIVALNAAVLVRKLQQITSGCAYDDDRSVVHIHDLKLAALFKLVKEINEPVLIATQFIHERERILKALSGCEEFKESRLAAWNRGEIPAIVADTSSISHGLNMQYGGRIAIHYSLTYSGDSYPQFNARLARTNQKFVTCVYRLICPGTIDEAVAEVLRQKMSRQAGLMEVLTNLQKLDAAI